MITQLYGLPRSTSDIDVMEMTPADESTVVMRLAEAGSVLARRYGIYLQYTAVQTVPESYLDRLVEMFPGWLRKLRLFALDPYDLALSKLERNTQRDRDDVKHLAMAVPLDPGVLKGRYEEEMRPYLARPDREDLTLKLWLEMIRNIG